LQRAHRLAAFGGKIDDGEPAEREHHRHFIIHPDLPVIGAAVAQRVGHGARAGLHVGAPRL
jgi:hypothetical protein